MRQNLQKLKKKLQGKKFRVANFSSRNSDIFPQFWDINEFKKKHVIEGKNMNSEI